MNLESKIIIPEKTLRRIRRLVSTPKTPSNDIVNPVLIIPPDDNYGGRWEPLQLPVPDHYNVPPGYGSEMPSENPFNTIKY